MKNRLFLTPILIFSFYGLIYSQTDTVSAKLNNTDNFVDYINANVKYPEIAVENNIQGKVEFQFTISLEGCIQSIEITSDSDPNLKKAVIKVLKKTECNWTPARIGNDPVSVSMSSSIDFKLEDRKKKKRR